MSPDDSNHDSAVASDSDSAAPTSEPSPERPARLGPISREARSFVELFAISGLAIVQPALDVLSKNTEIIVSRRSTPLQIVLLTLILMLVPPAGALVIEIAIGAVAPRARRYAHAVLIAIFAGVLVEESLKHGSSLGQLPLVIVGVVAAIGAGVLVLRVEAARTFLRFLGFAPIAFALLFIFASPVTDAVLQHEPSAAAVVKIHHPKRVVMIVFDEFPLETLMDGNGHIDASIFPNFAALANTSTWYRNDTSVAKYTEFAVPAIDTGKLPASPSATPTSVDYPDSIFRLLGRTYRMNVHEQEFERLCPASICPDTTPGASNAHNVSSMFDATLKLWKEFASPKRTEVKLVPANPTIPAVDKANQFLQGISARPGAELDYVHILMPHQPWRYNGALQDDGSAQLSPGGGYGVWDSESSAAIGRERHVLNTQAADTLLGKTIAKLRRLHLWNDSIVIVTADHGMAFTGGEPLRGATDKNAKELLWTPLFIKGAGQTAGVADDRPMQSIDIVPTLAEMLGTKIPWKVDGVSALGQARPEFKRRFYQWGPAQPGQKWVAPPGYLTFDAPSRFAQVLATQSVDPVGPPALRPYRIGKYRALMGQSVAGLVQKTPGGPSLLYVPDATLFRNVDPTAKVIPWSWIQGFVSNVGEDHPLAFAVNGVVAGLSNARRLENSRSGYYSGSLAPTLFRKGANVLTAYTISGPPDHPVLNPIPIYGNPGVTDSAGGGK